MPALQWYGGKSPIRVPERDTLKNGSTQGCLRTRASGIFWPFLEALGSAECATGCKQGHRVRPRTGVFPEGCDIAPPKEVRHCAREGEAPAEPRSVDQCLRAGARRSREGGDGNDFRSNLASAWPTATADDRGQREMAVKIAKWEASGPVMPLIVLFA